ncbi:hypothetical protein [Baaleninema sp.]
MRSRSHPLVDFDRFLLEDGVTGNSDESLAMTETAIAEAEGIYTYS